MRGIFVIRSIFGFILLSGVCIAQSIPAPRIDFSPEQYVCYRANETLLIDGQLSETSWKSAEWTRDFMDIEGSVKPVPRFRTRAKMLWDDNYFYIAAELQEPDIWGTLQNRDDIIFYDNDFEVFIDPDGNTHSYCEFEMNALNTVWDLLLIQPYRDINNAAVHAWDIKGLKSGVKVYGSLNEPGDIDSSWTVEIAFPWSAFKEISEAQVPPNNNDQWRVNFSRVEWKTEVVNNVYQKVINPETGKSFPEDNWVWSPQGVVNMHYPEMWGYVQFSEKTAGSDKILFHENEDEKAKWYLRGIYYLEKLYFEENKKYTLSIEELGFSIQDIPGFVSTPQIECTSGMFEAVLVSEDGTYCIIIDDNGLTRKVKLKL